MRTEIITRLVVGLRMGGGVKGSEVYIPVEPMGKRNVDRADSELVPSIKHGESGWRLGAGSPRSRPRGWVLTVCGTTNPGHHQKKSQKSRRG